jgi:hypothetical protein
MVVEALSVKEEEEKSAARSASDTLLDLCRGSKKKSVGMIGRNLLNPDFVPSLLKPPFKSVMMLPGRGMSAQEFRPVNRTKAREAEKTKAREEGGNVRRKSYVRKR